MLLRMSHINYYEDGVGGFMRKNFDVIIIILIFICILLLICCAILLYMVFLYKNELNQNKKGAIIYNSDNTNIGNSNDRMDVINIPNIPSRGNLDINNNLKLSPLTSIVPTTTITVASMTSSTQVTPISPATPINVLENDSINDITMYNSCNSKNYNKKFVSINSEDNILSSYASTSKQTFDTSSNINDYLSHSYSYNNGKIRKHQYHHRKNNSSFINSNHKRFPSIKKPKPLYERQSSITSTIGSVKSMIKRHYSIRSKNHSRHHSSSNSKIPSILIQNNIPLNFINEELDNKTPSLNEYCQSLNSSITDNNQNSKPKLNYISSSSSKIKFDEDLPITDVLLPSSSYSYSSKTVLCSNSYDNYLYNDIRNEDFINTVNNIELNNMYKENYDSNRIYNMAYNIKKPEESIYSLSTFSSCSDKLCYECNMIEEPKNETINENVNEIINETINEDINEEINENIDENIDENINENVNVKESSNEYELEHEAFKNECDKLEKMNLNSMDISSLNIEYKKEE